MKPEDVTMNAPRSYYEVVSLNFVLSKVIAELKYQYIHDDIVGLVKMIQEIACSPEFYNEGQSGMKLPSTDVVERVIRRKVYGWISERWQVEQNHEPCL